MWGFFCYNKVNSEGSYMIKPLRDLVLIRIEKEAEKQTSTGIYIPKDAWNEVKPYGTVEEVGAQVTDFKAGDKVYINPYAMLDMPGFDDDLKMIKECDILAYV